MKRDFNILNYFNMRALFIGIGISRIISTSHELSWISIIIGTLLGLIILKYINISIKNNIINVIISCIFIIISLVIIINMISTMYLTHMMKLVIGIPIILLVIYILSKKELVIYRISSILFFILLFFFIISIIILLPNIELSNLMYTNTSIKDVIISSIYYAILSTVPTFITRKDNTYNIDIRKTYIFSSISLLLLIFIIYLIIGPDLANIIRYPEYIALKSIHISEVLTNIENMFSLVWLIDLLMFIISSANRIKDIVNNNTILNIILIGLLIIVSIINKYYQLVLAIYLYILPILLVSLFLLFIINKKST
jgi:hypothetical protein